MGKKSQSIRFLQTGRQIRRKVYTFWVISFLITGIIQTMDAQANEKKDYKPEYLLGVRWEVDEMPYSILWQGVYLTFHGDDSTVDLRLPVSQYVKKGRNEFSLISWLPKYNETQKMALSMIYWRPGENPNTEAKTAFRVVMYPGKKPLGKPVVEYNPESGSPLRPVTNHISFNINKDYDELKVSFENSLQMPTWSWEEGEVLTNDRKTRDSLTKVYRKMHTLLERQNNDALMDMVSVMIEETALAYDKPAGYVRQRAGFDINFEHPEIYQLVPFPQKPMTLNLGAGNRVAWLTTKGVTKPIRFKYVMEDDRYSMVNTYFIRKDGKWILSR